MKPTNLLILMSDEHNPKIMGCSGHPIAQTPNIDALARTGTMFTSAYTTSPVCVPARAAFAVGKYVHQIGYWDNADAYDGAIPSWHHRLRERGHHVAAIGKLHFRGWDGDDYGFDEMQIPMQIIEGKGDLMGLVRRDLPERGLSWKIAKLAGPGETPYTAYDRDICTRAQVWLHEEAPRHVDKPWVLFVSFVCPHFPLVAPAEFYYRYPAEAVALPKQYRADERPQHPYLRDYASSFVYDRYFDPEKLSKAIRAYYGLVSFVDDNVGKILRVLDETGLAATTRVMYTSDHGDNLGARGLWGKSTMYEEVAGVPLILKGPDVPAGRRVATPASHVDAYPFIMACAGEDHPRMYDGHPGHSLLALAEGARPERNVLSEYHGMGSTTAAFMIRHGRYKYVHYVAYAPQLFDLERDPEELTDLAGDPAYAAMLAECRERLYRICDPAAVDARAKQRQGELLALHGGREAVIKRGDLGFSPPPGYPILLG
ncbi:MAG TPA: sulfatase-like hydrolase/transferase [Burkholderiales bacterium]|jgi:choline-sulfatase|nr:sulfatase-like hydrolase/transferase [Burkholderiales bacterium]